jgi:hypothetical protein
MLLTATPMQVDPIEVWDLLSLLGLPSEWTENAFRRFFNVVEQPNPSPEAVDDLARLFQSAEREYGSISTEEAVRSAMLLMCRVGNLRMPTVRPRSHWCERTPPCGNWCPDTLVSFFGNTTRPGR